MARGRGGLYRPDGRRRMSRPAGCLVLIVALLALLIVLSILFSGFQQGSRVNGDQSPSVMNVLNSVSG
jgi:hypothetical protein